MGTTGADALGEEMGAALEAWAQRPGAQVLMAVGAHLRRRMGILLWFALIGFAAAWPLAGSGIGWVIEDAGLLPEVDGEPQTWEVTVTSEDRFVPAIVHITAGDSVRWVWNGSASPHNVVEVGNGTGTSGIGGFDSGAAASVLGMNISFDEVGTHHYVSEPQADAGMRGQVVVERAGGLRLVVLTPVELMLLKLRISVAMTVAALAVVVLADGAWQASRSSELRARLSALDIRVPRPGVAVVTTVVSSLTLAVAGAAYALWVITPLVLTELQQDAVAAGLATTWQLGQAIGFVVGLVLGGMVGFQVPVAVLLARRTGAVERAQLIAIRRHLWFGAFVLGAILTPPDPLSMVLVAAPMVVLLEVTLLLDVVWPVRRAHREA